MALLPGDVEAPTTSLPADVVARSERTAKTAARRAGVVIRPLQSPTDMTSAGQLIAQVWKSSEAPPLDASLLRALAHTGNFVAGAFEDTTPVAISAGDAADGAAVTGRGALVGLSAGFFTARPKHGLHSHLTCTATGRQDAGLGAALKLHQRAWALAAGLTSVTWTVDPLVGRNAYFNFAKLGARAVAYLPDFYGPMEDGVNAGDESDRLLMAWALPDALPGETAAGGQRVAALDPAAPFLLTNGPDGEPHRFDVAGDVVACQVPVDIVAMRERDPGQALRWRHALRHALLSALDAGYHIQGFTRSSCYVLAQDSLRRGTSAEGA